MNEEEIKTDEGEVISQTDTKGREKFIKVLSGVLFIVIFIILLIFDVSWKWIAIVMIPLFLLVVVIAAWDYIFKFFNKQPAEKASLPNAASAEELWKAVDISLTNLKYMDHVKEHIRVVPHNVGKNLIYEFVVKSLYNQGYYHIIINAHFPNRISAVLSNPRPIELKKAINGSSTTPAEEPDFEETVSYNPLLGTEVTTKRKSSARKHRVIPRGDLE